MCCFCTKLSLFTIHFLYSYLACSIFLLFLACTYTFSLLQFLLLFLVFRDPFQCYSFPFLYLTCFQRFNTSSFKTRDRDRDRFLAGYTFRNIYRAVAVTEILKILFEVHRSVLIFHTKFVPAVSFINGKVSLRRRKTGLCKGFLRLQTCIFDSFTKERASNLNSR